MRLLSKVSANETLIGVSVIVTALVAGSFMAERTVPANLLPHGVCFSWLPALLWLHVISDALIGIAYLSIPIGLVLLVRRRKDLPLNWMFLLFGLFIVSCGITHLVGIWTIWNPDYWFAGSVKAVTAAASVLTAFAMIPALPRALKIPTTAQLQRANQELQVEIRRRKEVEEQLRTAQLELEQRVADRTRDLAEARAAADRLRMAAEEANHLKDRFLAKVSHELRTPLQAMMSWSTLLEMNVEEKHPASSAARRIAENVRAQARLIDDLLDISRILSGKLRLELETADAREIVERALDVVQPGADRAGVRIERNFALDKAQMITDPDRLEQVIWNLANNAIQASRTGSTVTVDARTTGGRLQIRVDDQGIGISKDELDRIFEPFQQSHHATGHRGLGLGLAITRSIVALLGGRISAASDGPGRGASFSVSFPLVCGEARAQSRRELRDDDLQLLRQARVIYVEDDSDIADPLAAAIAPMVAGIQVFYSASEALRVKVEDPQLVLLSDLNLGQGDDGLTLLRTLREKHGFTGPAIALSAYGEPADRQRSAVAGFDAHLVKPATAHDVAVAIVTALRQRTT